MSSRSGTLLIVGGLLVALAGCYLPPSAGDLSRINIGMSKSAVTSCLGQPCYAASEGKAEIYHYRFVEGGQPFGKTAGYYVRMMDGNVESYGKDPTACTETPAAPGNK